MFIVTRQSFHLFAPLGARYSAPNETKQIRALETINIPHLTAQRYGDLGSALVAASDFA